jgi:acetylornithine deacetylase/succinyl-diaminopimelate desuccinylase-like protein
MAETAIDAALARFLAGERERQEAFLAALVRAPSDNPPGDCAPHAERAAALLEGLGLVVERHPVPQAEVRANGMLSVTNLVVRHRFGAAGPVIALNAHGDVVPPGGGWSVDPYAAVVRDGVMYGRGVAVSKADFATYTWALLALRASEALHTGAVELHFTYDEEAGGAVGPGFLLRQGITRPDLAIGAGFSYAVTTAHNGCLHLEVVVEGRSAHAAKPATGVDALETATGILAALYASRPALVERVSAVPGIGSPQLTVGLIAGGTNTNVVPDRVAFRLDRRMIPEETPEVVETELRQLIAAAAAAHPRARVAVRRILLARPLVRLAGVDRLAATLCEQARCVLGEPVGETGSPFYTDARHYAEAGVPIALYGAGPRTIEEANSHRADERLKLSDLHAATLVVARTLARVLAPAG